MNLYAELSKPFDPKYVQSVQKGNRTESYVNHAVVTNRLNGVLGIEGWSFRIVEVFSYVNESGSHVGHVLGEIQLHENWGGAVRQDIGVPSRISKYDDEIKTAASDALKRAAMRFGVAIQLWHNQLEAFGGEQGLAGVVPSPPSTPSQGENSDPRPATKEAGGVGEDPPASAPTFEELVAIAGSVSAAREAINEATGADYTPARVRLSSDLERIAARALLLGVESA